MSLSFYNFPSEHYSMIIYTYTQNYAWTSLFITAVFAVRKTMEKSKNTYLYGSFNIFYAITTFWSTT